MGTGAKGHVRLGLETTWGTAATTFEGHEALSESLTLDYDRYPFKNLVATVAEPDDMAGIGRLAGDLVVPGYPLSLGRLLKGCFATTVASLSASLFTSTFRTPLTDFSADTPYQPYSVDVFRDVTSADRYLGCVVTRLTLDLRPNQDLRATASFVGKSTATVAATTPSFTTSPAQPFSFETASLSLAGAGTAEIEALTITIDNAIDAIAALNASSTIAKMRRRDAQSIRIAGTLDFANRTEYAKFVSQSEQALTLALTRAASFALTVTVPRAMYLRFPTTTRDRGRLTVDFEMQGRYATSGANSGTAIQVALTDTTTY